MAGFFLDLCRTSHS